MNKRRLFWHVLLAAVNGALLLWILIGRSLGGAAATGDGTNKPAPAFQLADLTGKQRSLKEFAGEVLLVDFWATWCKPCVKALPHLNEFAAEFKDGGFRVIAITVDEEDELDGVKELIAEKKLDHLLVLLDPDSEISEAYQVGEMPSSYLINRQQQIIGVYRGAPDPKAMHFDIMEAVVK